MSVATLDPTVFAAAIVTVIAALGGMTIQIINALSGAKDRREAAAERKALMDRTNLVVKSSDETAHKADVLIESTAKIHELTNSTNSNLQKALEVAAEKIAGFERIISQMESQKRDTAAARVITDQQAAIALAAPSPAQQASAPHDAAPHTEQYDAAVVTSLRKIDDNTAAIAVNTTLDDGDPLRRKDLA